VSIDEIWELARQALVPPFSAVFLFGSYARGDQDRTSDVDILQVAPTRTKSYSKGNMNVTCYTPDQLIALSKSGSMFARHLVLEAVPIFDPENFLGILKAGYVPANDYLKVCGEVTCAIPLLAVAREEFDQNPRYYSAAAAHLLRTYVYAKAFTLGAQSFSMRVIAHNSGDYRPRECLIGLRLSETYSQFWSVVALQSPCVLLVGRHAACQRAVTRPDANSKCPTKHDDSLSQRK